MRNPTQPVAAQTDVAPQTNAGREAGYLPEDRVDYWIGACERVSTRNAELRRQVSELSQPHQGAGRALADIATERRRQVEVHGWTPEHDDKHDAGEFAAAAAAYALNAGDQLNPHSQGDGDNQIPAFWPFEAASWKPGDPRRDLVKAGALIAAEIERLDRAADAQPQTGEAL